MECDKMWRQAYGNDGMNDSSAQGHLPLHWQGRIKMDTIEVDDGLNPLRKQFGKRMKIPLLDCGLETEIFGEVS